MFQEMYVLFYMSHLLFCEQAYPPPPTEKKNKYKQLINNPQPQTHKAFLPPSPPKKK